MLTDNEAPPGARWGSEAVEQIALGRPSLEVGFEVSTEHVYKRFARERVISYDLKFDANTLSRYFKAERRVEREVTLSATVSESLSVTSAMGFDGKKLERDLVLSHDRQPGHHQTVPSGFALYKVVLWNGDEITDQTAQEVFDGDLYRGKGATLYFGSTNYQMYHFVI